MKSSENHGAGTPLSRRKYNWRNYPRKRLFESDFFEFFSVSPVAGPALLWVPVISWLLWQGVVGQGVHGWELAGLAFAALLTWTFMEYALHRFLFHAKFPGRHGSRMHQIIHGIHHEQPEDPGRLVMPAAPAIMIAYPLYLAFGAVLGGHRIDVFFAFFLLGYLAYDYTHYYLHHFTPKTAWGRYLKKSHMLHHFAEDEVRWGVTNPFWDLVFRTYHLPKRLRPSTSGGAGNSEPVLTG